MNLKSQPPLLIYQSSEWVSFVCLKIACCSRQRAIISLCYSYLILMKKMESTELWTLDLFRMLLIMQPKREKEVLIKVLCEISQRLFKKKKKKKRPKIPCLAFFSLSSSLSVSIYYYYYYFKFKLTQTSKPQPCCSIKHMQNLSDSNSFKNFF